jgi:hypothetical protein
MTTANITKKKPKVLTAHIFKSTAGCLLDFEVMSFSFEPYWALQRRCSG